MATQTTYYNFNKPSGTDLVNPLVDTNPNWDIADTALHELNERSVANCTEVVSLGVHALSTLNTDTKFLKWIATANFTAGDTFTLNGIAVAAATPSGASLATNAYVAGAVVMACLNADNTAMTVFLSGTNVAYDSERLGGELPSYYATDSDMDNAQSDITNIQNTLGNTSIVGIGDGTATGAISAINSDLGNKVALLDNSSTWHQLSLNVSGGSSYITTANGIYVLLVKSDGTGIASAKWCLNNTYTNDLVINANEYSIAVSVPLKAGTEIFARNAQGSSYQVVGYYDI